MYDQFVEQKRSLIQRWAANVYHAALDGTIGDGQPIEIGKPSGLAGPRAAVLLIPAGLNTGRLLRKLDAQQSALARQFVPFQFAGEPNLFIEGRDLRIEVNWPESYAWRDVRATELNRRPYDPGRFLCGVTDTGSTLSVGYSAELAHYGVFGATGSGKTTALQTILIQLAANGRGRDRFVILDGKNGPMLRGFDRLPGAIGPVVSDVERARNALALIVTRMAERYSRREENRIIVAIDEVTEFMRDPACAEMIQRLARLGREANINLLLGTQRPSLLNDPTVKGNLLGRIVLSLANANDSYQATDRAEIHADRLGGAGDAYVMRPGLARRTQIARYTPAEIDRVLMASPELGDYPAYEAEDLGQEPKAPGIFTPAEVSASLIAASQNYGRDRLRSLVGQGGNSKLTRLLRFGRDIYTELQANDYELNTCLPA